MILWNILYVLNCSIEGILVFLNFVLEIIASLFQCTNNFCFCNENQLIKWVYDTFCILNILYSLYSYITNYALKKTNFVMSFSNSLIWRTLLSCCLWSQAHDLQINRLYVQSDWMHTYSMGFLYLQTQSLIFINIMKKK